MITNYITRKSRVIAYALTILVVCVAFTYLFTFVYNSAISMAQLRSKDPRNIKFNNLTKSFPIVKSEIVGDDLFLVVQNNYDKSINGFYVTEDRGNGEAVTTTVELICSGVRTEIAPGEQFTYHTGVGEALLKYGLTVSTVIFTDGTGEGDPEIIQRVNEVRRGRRSQMEKGLELLRGTSSIAEFGSRLDELKNSVADLKRKDETRSEDYNSGLSEGKASIEMDIKELEKRSRSIGFDKDLEFSELEKRLEKIISLSPR